MIVFFASLSFASEKGQDDIMRPFVPDQEKVK